VHQPVDVEPEPVQQPGKYQDPKAISHERLGQRPRALAKIAAPKRQSANGIIATPVARLSSVA
jgi:hypothetical protein